MKGNILDNETHGIAHNEPSEEVKDTSHHSISPASSHDDGLTNGLTKTDISRIQFLELKQHLKKLKKLREQNQDTSQLIILLENKDLESFNKLSNKKNLNSTQAKFYGLLKQDPKTKITRITDAEKSELKKLYFSGISQTSRVGDVSHSTATFTHSSRIGPQHTTNQDTFIAATIDDDKVAKTTIEQLNKNLINQHQNWKSGSTASMIFFKKDQENPYQSKIITNNLGDSRAIAIIKNKRGKHYTISLTKDQNLKTPKIVQFINQKNSNFTIQTVSDGHNKKKRLFLKGFTSFERKDTSMSAAGTLGDNPLKKWKAEIEKHNKKHPNNKITESNITGYPFNKFDVSNEITPQELFKGIKLKEQDIEEFTLAVVCDGVMDVLRTDYHLDNQNKVVKSSNIFGYIGRNITLSDKTKISSILDKNPGRTTSEQITRKSLTKKSSDNCTCITGNISQMTTSILAGFDGHGDSGEDIEPGEDIFYSGGKVFSNSTAALTFLDLDAKEIKGLELEELTNKMIEYHKRTKAQAMLQDNEEEKSKSSRSNSIDNSKDHFPGIDTFHDTTDEIPSFSFSATTNTAIRPPEKTR